MFGYSSRPWHGCGLVLVVAPGLGVGLGLLIGVGAGSDLDGSLCVSKGESLNRV